MSQLIHNTLPTYDREHLIFTLKLYLNFSQIKKGIISREDNEYKGTQF